MPNNDIATFKPLPADKFDIIVNRPVFVEHEATEHYQDPETGEDKTRVVKYDRDTLDAICRNVNKRVLDTGDYVALTDGHTPTKDEKLKGAKDPDVLGYAGPFHLEQIGDLDPKWAIVADRFATFKGDDDRVKRRGRVSVEMYEIPDATRRFFDPIALLGSDMPRLPLGITYSAAGCEGFPVQRYGMPSACFAGGNNTFVPTVEGKPPKKARYDDEGNELPSETMDIKPSKAKKMLKEGEAHGHELTEKQRGFLGAVAGKERNAMGEGEEPAEPDEHEENLMALSDEDVAKLVDAFMQTEPMQFVDKLMLEEKAKGDQEPEPDAATAAGASGEPIPVGDHAIPKSKGEVEPPKTPKEDLGEEILPTGLKVPKADHAEHELPKPKGEKGEHEKENYAMTQAAAVARARAEEELKQEKARYAQEKADLVARLEKLETARQSEVVAQQVKARHAQVSELCARYAVHFEEEYPVCKDMSDAEFERHVATIRKYATRLDAPRIPVAEPEGFNWNDERPGSRPQRPGMPDVNHDDPRVRKEILAIVNRHTNAGKKISYAEAADEWKKSRNGQPVGA